MPVVIIVGLASMQGLQAARIFARHKIPVIALTDDLDYYTCQTRVCREIYLVKTKSEDLIAFLEKKGPEFAVKPVLVTCQDENVLSLSRNRDRLAKWYHFLLPESASLEMLMDKSAFYRYAEAHGYPVPKTFYVKSESELLEAIRGLNFPCLVKPPGRASSRWSQESAFKAYKISNREDLLALYSVCKGWTDTLLVQEWIEGTDADLFSCNCYFSAASEPLVTFVARKIRQYPPVTGESSLGIECRNDTVLQVTLDLFREVGLRGLGYLEIKCDVRTGKHYIIEPNIGRPTGRSAIAEAGGVELLYTMYCDLLGRPLPAAREQRYTGVKWLHLSRDCASAFYYWRKGELSLWGWLQSIRGKKTHAVFSLKDPWPFFADIRHTIRLVMSRGERRRRDSGAMLVSLRQANAEMPAGDLSATDSRGRSPEGP